jgi:RNA recognition motif-containing protein
LRTLDGPKKFDAQPDDRLNPAPAARHQSGPASQARIERIDLLWRNMAVRLFVGNLPYDTTEAELREHFSAVGPLTFVRIATDRESGRPRGFAFVEFDDPSQAEEAVRRFNNQMFKGRPLAVNEARAKEDRGRAGAPPRPPLARPTPPPAHSTERAPAGGERGSRDFGPDAPPRRSRNKVKKTPRSERAPKGPMREVVRGQFFGDDGDTHDDWTGENFASRVSDSDDEYDQDND